MAKYVQYCQDCHNRPAEEILSISDDSNRSYSLCSYCCSVRLGTMLQRMGISESSLVWIKEHVKVTSLQQDDSHD